MAACISADQDTQPGAAQDIILRGNLQDLFGKRIAIHVTDPGLNLYFTDTSGFCAIAAHDSPPDLAISASTHDFILLTTCREDPDTLFFNRRLVVEGGTELGLVAKKTLDSIDLPGLAVLHPARMLSRIRMRRLNLTSTR